MKRTLLLLIALLCAGVVSAQDYERNIVGLRGGLNFSWMTVSEGAISLRSDNRTGFYIGVSDQIRLNRLFPLYLETGLEATSRGGRLKDEFSCRPYYLQVPLLLNFHADIRHVVTFQPAAGIYCGLGLAGKIESEGGGKSDMFGDGNAFKRMDFGIRLGAGFTFRRHIHIGLSYDIGCMDRIKGDVKKLMREYGYGNDVKMRTNCLTLAVGYNF